MTFFSEGPQLSVAMQGKPYQNLPAPDRLVARVKLAGPMDNALLEKELTFKVEDAAASGSTATYSAPLLEIAPETLQNVKYFEAFIVASARAKTW